MLYVMSSKATFTGLKLLFYAGAIGQEETDRQVQVLLSL